MRRGLLATWFLVAVIVGLLAIVPAASASNVDFSCTGTTGPLACTGTVTNNLGVYSTTGIGVFQTAGPYTFLTPFTLLFNTQAGTISISNNTATLSGTFTGFSTTSGSQNTTLTLAGVVWNSLPLTVQNWLGTPTGIDNADIQFQFSNGVVQSVDVNIAPTPEPGSLMLLGSGLLLGGGILRRKLRL